MTSMKREDSSVLDHPNSNSLLENTLANLKIEEPDELNQETPLPPELQEEEESDKEEEEEDSDLNNIEPVDPWAEGETEPFTEEDLINVLRSFEEEDDDDGDSDSVDFPKGEALPELVFDEVEDPMLQLLPPTEFTASIFEIPNDDNNTNNNTNQDSDENDSRLTEIHSNSLATEAQPLDEKKREANNDDDDDEDLGLLEGLRNLNLDWKPEDDDDDNDNDIPPYLYCQPCTPVGTSNANSNFSLAAIAEDEALLDQSTAIAFRQLQKERPKLPQKEFDTLLQLSLLSLDDSTNPYLSEAEMDSLFAMQGEPSDETPNQGLNGDTRQNELIAPQNHPPPIEELSPHEQHIINVSQRPEALDAAKDIMASFTTNASGHLNNERSCLGHKETIFGTSFSECGKYLATASQDSTIRIWNVATNSLLTTLREHSNDFECLRVAWASSNWAKDILHREKDSIHSSLLASAGADGTVKIWSNTSPSQKDAWHCCATIDHADFDRLPSNPDDDADKPQVYALQWIDHWSGLPVSSDNTTQNSFLLTSSDDFIHLWELERTSNDTSGDLRFREVLSLNFTSFHNQGYGVAICQVTNAGIGVQNSTQGETSNHNDDNSTPDSSPATIQKAFGGDRNPNNMIFAFDADYCPANGLLGVALSDGTLRLMNGRGVCISIMQLPGCQSHLTSFSWDATGSRLAICVATGHVILWGIDVHDGSGSLTTTCTAILEGGHELGRPVFGSRFCGSGENLLLTWGVDCRLCLWDSFSQGNIHAPIATLVAKTDYPIYAVDVQPSCVAVGGGGGGEASFLGIPVFLYDTK